LTALITVRKCRFQGECGKPEGSFHSHEDLHENLRGGGTPVGGLSEDLWCRGRVAHTCGRTQVFIWQGIRDGRISLGIVHAIPGSSEAMACILLMQEAGSEARVGDHCRADAAPP
jgi:hypothetical protein